jgi:Flp pilus assembly pilin Flp
MIPLLVRALLSLRTREEGQTLLEYGLVISLVSIGALIILDVIGGIPGGFLTQMTADL